MIERQNITRNMTVAAILLVVLFITGCSSKPTAESIAKGKELTYTRCTGCHSAQNFEKHRYARAEWDSVIGRMMGHGAQITPEEQGLIADFLSSKYSR